MTRATYPRPCWLAAALLALLVAPLRAERYVALMRDGEVRHGERLRHFDEERSIRLDDKSLLDEENPVRVLRDTTVSPRQLGPHIEMINGDLLAGKVLKICTGEAAAPWPDYLIVESTSHSGQVRVRLDWIRRIARQPRPSSALTPGHLLLIDGRQVAARSCRFTPVGLRILTADGIAEFNLDQIADLYVEAPQDWAAPFPAIELLDGDPPAVVRIKTESGEAFTFPHEMVTDEFDKEQRRKKSSEDLLATRPFWSLDSILFDADAIAFQTYFSAGEVPLSLLNVAQVQQKAALAHLPWQRNLSVHAAVLQSGPVSSELGIGMHSFCRLTFALPRNAAQFTSLVGLDRKAGAGGCVHCRVFVDGEAKPRWQREFLRGSDGLQSVGPVETEGAQTLTLEVDFADKDLPHGADPLDVRDWVNWLMPMVHLAPAQARNPADVGRLIPELAGWSINAEALRQLKLRPAWMKRESRWFYSLDVDDVALKLTREDQITLQNAWLPIRASRDDASGKGHEIYVTVDGRDVGSTMNGNVRTLIKEKFDERTHILPRSERPVELSVVAQPRGDGDNCGIVWDRLGQSPLIRSLPDDGRPIEPEVPLTSLAPARAVHQGKALELLPGRVNQDQLLNVRGWQFEAGYGVPTGSEIAYELDPSWRKFVAVIGLADGWHGAGPYQILLDDQLHWTSQQKFARNDPGEQIVVPIPRGSQTITLRLLGHESGGAFAHAGFLCE